MIERGAKEMKGDEEMRKAARMEWSEPSNQEEGEDELLSNSQEDSKSPFSRVQSLTKCV